MMQQDDVPPEVNTGDATGRGRITIGRDWVLAAIDRWTDDRHGPRFFAVLGEPGIGKTVIAEALVARGGLAASHFCIARRADTVDPLAFVHSLLQQLLNIPGFGDAVADIQGMSVTGQATATANYGRMTGVHIEHIGNFSVHAPSAIVAFNEMIVRPLQRLYAGGFAQPLLILVDGLDEAAAVGDETIITLLANAHGLPPDVRFVVTSRPDDAALCHLEGRHASLLIDAESEENVADVRRYLAGRIAESATLRAAVSARGVADNAFVDRVVAASRGNFLYVAWLLRAVEDGAWWPDASGELPRGLDGLYREFLSTRRMGPEREGWTSLYRPVLGALVAAQEPLDLDLLCAFTGLTPEGARDVLADVQQFLVPSLFREGRYELYHQSVVDFLSDARYAAAFWVDRDAAHRAVVARYRGAAARWGDVEWSRVDAYGLRHLSAHLFALRAEDAARRDLYALICVGLMEEKRRRSGSYETFTSDVAFALEAARMEPDNDLVEEVRCSFVYATIRSLSTVIPPRLLGALVDLGQVERARAIARLSAHPARRCQSHQAIAEASLRLGRDADARYDVRAAMEAFDVIADDRTKELILEALPRLAAATGDEDGLRRLRAWCETIADDRSRGWALDSVARALLILGDTRGAVSLARRIGEDTTREHLLYDAIHYLCDKGEWDEASGVAADIGAAWFGASARAIVACRLARAGDMSRARAIVDGIDDGRPRAQAYCAVARTLHDDGLDDTAVAIAMVEGARDSAGAEIDVSQRSWALRSVAATLAAIGDAERAKAMIDAIADTSAAAQALIDLVGAAHERGDDRRARGLLDRALSLAATIPDDAPNKGTALGAIAIRMALVGDERAMSTAGAMPDGWPKGGTLGRIAGALLDAGKVDEALAAADRALPMVDIRDAERVTGAIKPLGEVLGVLVLAGRADRALSIVAAMPDGYPRGWLLGELGGAIVRAGVIDEALEIADTIGDHYRLHAISRIVDALNDAGMYDEIVAIARSHEADPTALDLLADAAVYAHRAGRVEDASAIIDRAVLLAETDASPRTPRSEDDIFGDPLPWTLVQMADALLEAGRADEAARVADGARAVADRCPDAPSRALLLARVARVLAGAGQANLAVDAVREAVALVAAGDGDGGRSIEGQRAAQALAEAGYLDEAFAVAKALTHPAARLLAVGEVTVTAAEAGDRVRAIAGVRAVREDARAMDSAAAVRGLAAVAWASHVLRETWVAAEVEDQLQDTAERVADEDARADAFGVLAATLARGGQLVAARRAADEIGDASRRDMALAGVAAGAAQAGDIDTALGVAADIADVFWRAQALHTIAHAASTNSTTCPPAGTIDRMAALVDGIPNDLGRPWLFNVN